MEIRADRFERQLAGESLQPVYLIAGAEPLIVLEFADAVRRKAREEGYSEREVFDVDASFDWNILTMAMNSLSLFSSRRLFDVRLPTGKPGREGSEAIQTYCQNPPPDTVLMITAQDWSKAHAGKWTDAIAKTGHWVPVWPIKPGELEGWLEKRLRSRGLSADSAALTLLAERVEGNLLAAAQEVDKLSLLLGNAQAVSGATKSMIDATAMAALVADSARFNVFELTEAALVGDVGRIHRLLKALRGEGEQVAGLVPIIARELLTVAGLARTTANGGNVMSAMREARIWENKQALYRRAADRHPAARWEAFVGEAGRIDLLSKGRGTGDPWLALERLLILVADRKARHFLAA